MEFYVLCFALFPAKSENLNQIPINFPAINIETAIQGIQLKMKGCLKCISQQQLQNAVSKVESRNEIADRCATFGIF